VVVDHQSVELLVERMDMVEHYLVDIVKQRLVDMMKKRLMDVSVLLKTINFLMNKVIYIPLCCDDGGGFPPPTIPRCISFIKSSFSVLRAKTKSDTLF
jgi:hypothetical protein